MGTLIDAGINENKIIKIPLAYPEVSEDYLMKDSIDSFTFICIGSLSLTKGTHILLDAWRKHFSKLANAKLIFAGNNSLPDKVIENLPANIRIMGFLNKPDLELIYREADLLVFPTLGDGFGMVITEAMAHGIPVLTTKNSAGYDLIENEVDGFITEAGDAEALAERMRWIVENKSILPNMSKLIIEKAKKYQWSDYRKLLIKDVEKAYLDFKANKLTL
ncbi:MAG: glycosyltransferase [Pedobacter sp.]|nr:MAG: glycosyltransferase [Pedobacter sp.]